MSKVILAIFGLVLCASESCWAAECGAMMTDTPVGKLSAPLDRDNSVLLQHTQSLLAEAQSIAESPTFDKVMLEYDRVSAAYETGVAVQHSLDTMLLLAQIRDVMRDKRDRLILERYGSHVAYSTRSTSRIAQDRLNGLLAKIARPGIAIDVSKLRDSVNNIAMDFETCERPKTPHNK